MRVILLGSAAGGGFPQWNSNAPACRRARTGDGAARPRTQTSLAVSSDGESWFLLNAAPDLRQQIATTPSLWPRRGLRSSPIAGVVLTGADVDAIAGLLHLRERHRFTAFATTQVLATLAANPIFGVLAAEYVARRRLPLGDPVPLASPDGKPSGLVLEAFAVPGEVPLYLECGQGDLEPGDAALAGEAGTTIGLKVSEPTSGASLFFIPSCAAFPPDLAQRLRGAALVFFDGTLWVDDEMIRLGVGTKTGRRMGHMSVSGEDGVIAAFARLGIARKILVHVNNTNPVLLEDSPEHTLAAAAGWTVGHDGMELTL